MLETLIPIEAFFDPVCAEKIWPKSIAAQIRARREIIKNLDCVIKNLPRPDMTIETAVNQGFITEEQAEKLYISLSDLLSDSDYKRLLLYLPFEFLPGSAQFQRIYMKIWERLLWVKDVRANFVDGDVLEVQSRLNGPPRLVKAAHLIPKLVENGLIEIKNVIALMNRSDDQTLKDSIADALTAMGIETPRVENTAVLAAGPITKNREVWLKRRKKEKPIDYTQKRLAGPFSENLKLMREELNDIGAIMASIKANRELSKLIYPIVLIYGSRLNGYGGQSADIDLSVLVRPGTPLAKRAKLKKLLQAAFAHEKIKSHEIIEFWLEEMGSGWLKVSEPAEFYSDLSWGKASWAYILFGAAWMGDKEMVRELCRKLLIPYMRDNTNRQRYIEDMENSTLQYRLMHKGYGRFVPRCSGLNPVHADRIDGKSAFWDSGYRQLAVKLFVSKIFLPKIV